MIQLQVIKIRQDSFQANWLAHAYLNGLDFGLGLKPFEPYLKKYSYQNVPDPRRPVPLLESDANSPKSSHEGF